VATRWTGPLDISKLRRGGLVRDSMEFDLEIKFRMEILTSRYNPDIVGEGSATASLMSGGCRRFLGGMNRIGRGKSWSLLPL
jgi:hypothetical protein